MIARISLTSQKTMELANTKKLPRRKASDKTAAILEGAMQEFMAYGYAGASMDQIAVNAGVSKPTLYSYFRDKEGLFTALIHQLLQEEPTLINYQDPSLFQVPPRVFLRHLAMGVLERFSEDQPLLTLIRLILGESGRFRELAQAFVRDIEKPIIDALSQYFTLHPDLHCLDPEVAARTFIGALVHYIIIQEILYGREILPIERDRLVDGMIDLITGG